jgi:hypothetical protein
MVAAVRHAMAGRPGDAQEAARAGARESTPFQRRARIVNLRRFAAAAGPAAAAAVAPLIDIFGALADYQTPW